MEIKSRIDLLRKVKLLSKRETRSPEWVAVDFVLFRDFCSSKPQGEVGPN